PPPINQGAAAALTKGVAVPALATQIPTAATQPIQVQIPFQNPIIIWYF
ncbi:7535_t:CDS:1, partial [Funneliformis caledonium]